jgi:beta-phosphoglucomutase-like phosphatase (HAD superfamily)
MSRTRAVIFDFNGTLSHDEPILLRIYQELFAEHGRPLTADDYFSELAGNTEEAIISGWLEVDGAELDALVAERISRYNAAADGSTITAELRHAVRYAAERGPVAIVSGAFRAEIDPVLAAAGLTDVFAAVVTADDVEHGKPAPDGYLRALSLVGEFAPEEVVAFEDTEAGIASAKAAGLRCIAVLGTLAADRLSQADEIVEQIDVALLERLLDHRP